MVMDRKLDQIGDEARAAARKALTELGLTREEIGQGDAAAIALGTFANTLTSCSEDGLKHLQDWWAYQSQGHPNSRPSLDQQVNGLLIQFVEAITAQREEAALADRKAVV